MAEILDGLAAYAVSHFAVEEALMAKFGYPGYEEHKAEHERLNVQVKQLQEKLRNDRYTIETELATFMRRWLIGHIAYLDKKYTAHLNAAGVT
jgi:hemerythrin-like metal-binding protein